MSQNIRIGVDASTGGAEQAVNKIDRAAESAAESISDIGAAAAKADQAVNRLAESTERLAKAQKALEQETGQKFSLEDTSQFLDNFDRMRNSRRGIGAARMRQFDDFEGWYQGHRTAFGKENAAAHHRRSVFASGLQGTSYARRYGAPPPPDGGDGGGWDAGDMRMNPGARRAGSMAMGVLKGGLALAGINGIMSMIGSAVSKAAEESISNDTLKRATGDLTVDFQALRSNVRGATDGMGMVFQEGQRLAAQYAHGAGSAGVGNLESNLRSGIGFGRSYGMDPGNSVGFFATMRRLGVTDNEQSNRRLALMIGDSIAKSGNSAKADEVLAAVSNWAEQAARLTLNTPNVGAYGSYLTSMMASGRPGLDPANAASILSAADSATRRGGAMGEASLNFSLAALLRANPRMNPVTAMGLMEGGLFGTTRNTFGSGTSLGDWYGARGAATPGLDDRTNFEKMMPMLRQQYGAGSPFLLDAIKNHFGLSSLAQAAEFDRMYDNPANLRSSQQLLDRAGVRVDGVSATGIQTISRIASAGNGKDLGAIYDSIMARDDLTAGDRTRLTGAMRDAGRSGDLERLKEALVSVVGTKEQERTEGEKTRTAVTGVETAITTLGTNLLAPLNLIRDAIVAVARVISDDFRDAEREQQQRSRLNGQYPTQAQSDIDRRQGVVTGVGVNAHKEYHALGPGRDGLAGERFRNITGNALTRYREARRRSPNGQVDIDAIAPRPDRDLLTRAPRVQRDPETGQVLTDPNANKRSYYAQLAARQMLEREEWLRTQRGGDLSGSQADRAALEAIGAPGGGGGAGVAGNVVSRQGGRWVLSDEAKAYLAETDRMLGMPIGTSERQLRQESGFNPRARSNQGALGMAQFLPGTAADMSRRVGRRLDPMNPADALVLHREYMGVAHGETGGNVDQMLMFYHGGPDRRGWGPKTRNYARVITGQTPLPSGLSGGGASAGGGQQGVSVGFAPATVTLQDAQGRARGQVTLNPFVSGGAAGTSR